jgi:hypothetical protein
VAFLPRAALLLACGCAEACSPLAPGSEAVRDAGAPATPAAFWNALRSDRYPLDDVSRAAPATGALQCPDDNLVVYRGQRVKLSSAVRIHMHFREPMAELEAVVEEVAREVYGRPPRRIVHAGTWVCRRVRNDPTRLSEHALGNAIDVRGFDFGPLARGPQARDAELPADLPRPLRRGFEIRVGRHWNADGELGAVHARFLRRLVEQLQERDVFRSMLGPAHPAHANHFHFDYAPYRYRVI